MSTKTIAEIADRLRAELAAARADQDRVDTVIRMKINRQVTQAAREHQVRTQCIWNEIYKDQKKNEQSTQAFTGSPEVMGAVQQAVTMDGACTTPTALQAAASDSALRVHSRTVCNEFLAKVNSAIEARMMTPLEALDFITRVRQDMQNQLFARSEELKEDIRNA